MPIYEPGLDVLVAKNVREGRLGFGTDLCAAVAGSLVIFLAVGTPPGADGSADMSQVEEVAHEIAKALNGYKVIVTKSTVPVGRLTTSRELLKKTANLTFDFPSPQIRNSFVRGRPSMISCGRTV